MKAAHAGESQDACKAPEGHHVEGYMPSLMVGEGVGDDSPPAARIPIGKGIGGVIYEGFRGDVFVLGVAFGISPGNEDDGVERDEDPGGGVCCEEFGGRGRGRGRVMFPVWRESVDFAARGGVACKGRGFRVRTRRVN